jgi:hypothetical protein
MAPFVADSPSHRPGFNRHFDIGAERGDDDRGGRSSQSTWSPTRSASAGSTWHSWSAEAMSAGADRQRDDQPAKGPDGQPDRDDFTFPNRSAAAKLDSRPGS